MGRERRSEKGRKEWEGKKGVGRKEWGESLQDWKGGRIFPRFVVCGSLIFYFKLCTHLKDFQLNRSNLQNCASFIHFFCQFMKPFFCKREILDSFE